MNRREFPHLLEGVSNKLLTWCTLALLNSFISSLIWFPFEIILALLFIFNCHVTKPSNSEIARMCVCSVTQLCLTLCDPMGCSPPGSCLHGISQTRILEWGAISFSRGPFWPRDGNGIFSVSCLAGGFLLLSHRALGLSQTTVRFAWGWVSVAPEQSTRSRWLWIGVLSEIASGVGRSSGNPLLHAGRKNTKEPTTSFQGFVNEPQACNSLRSIYSRKMAES